MKVFKLGFAILWTIIGVGDIMLAASGQDPTWVSVFCPLTLVILEAWKDWFEHPNK